MTFRLQQILEQLAFLKFEMALIIGALVVLVAGLRSGQSNIFKILYAGTLLAGMFFVDIEQEGGVILSGALTISSLAGLMKLLFAAVSVWIVFYPTARHASEYYFVVLAMITGSSFMLSANHLLVLYLSIELTSFASYLITNFGFKKASYEAGIKYLLFGGVSSAIMLYGISLLYGFTGTMVLTEMDLNMPGAHPMVNLGVLFLLGGIFFKISLAPFHIWVPSAYQEAPTDAVAVLSVVPKIAGFVLLHQVLSGMELLAFAWVGKLLSVLGIATILIGTFGALRQSNAKRLLAYGAIAHSGLLLAAVLIPGESGGVAFVWYALIYAIMNLAAFHLISIHEEHGILEMDGFRNLGKIHPYIGGILVLVMISLVGLPPTAGFTAKFYLFSAMWAWYQEVFDPFMLAYLVVAVLSVAVSLFFYLRIPFEYFIASAGKTIFFNISAFSRVMATIFCIVLLWIFFRPEILNKIAFHINFIDW